MRSSLLWILPMAILLFSCNETSTREDILDERERALIQRENELLLQEKQVSKRNKPLRDESVVENEELNSATSKRIQKQEQNQSESNPIPGEYPLASSRLLVLDDIIDMSPHDQTLMRNEIFARHGYAFKTQWLLEHFSQFPWYKPMYQDVSSRLSEIEKRNVKFLLEHEG
ncbi:MAG: YARHG domain-containing protein [Bacteroidota bacterium]|jgi:hypothetical protein